MKEKELSERSYHSSPGAVKDFMEGLVWKDMLIELNGSIEQIRDGLEMAKDFESVLRLQECLDTIRGVIEMPSVILEDMKIQNDRRKGAARGEQEIIKQEKDYE